MFHFVNPSCSGTPIVATLDAISNPAKCTSRNASCFQLSASVWSTSSCPVLDETSQLDIESLLSGMIVNNFSTSTLAVNFFNSNTSASCANQGNYIYNSFYAAVADGICHLNVAGFGYVYFYNQTDQTLQITHYSDTQCQVPSTSTLPATFSLPTSTSNSNNGRGRGLYPLNQCFSQNNPPSPGFYQQLLVINGNPLLNTTNTTGTINISPNNNNNNGSSSPNSSGNDGSGGLAGWVIPVAVVLSVVGAILIALLAYYIHIKRKEAATNNVYKGATEFFLNSSPLSPNNNNYNGGRTTTAASTNKEGGNKNNSRAARFFFGMPRRDEQGPSSVTLSETITATIPSVSSQGVPRNSPSAQGIPYN